MNDSHKMRGVLRQIGRPATLALAFLVSVAAVITFRGVFTSRNIDFRFRVADAKFSSRLQRSYAFYTTKADPVQSEHQRVAINVGEQSKDGFMAVHIPGNATSFRFDLIFSDDGTTTSPSQPPLTLDVDVNGEILQSEIPFRKDRPNYAWKKFDASDFATPHTNFYAMASTFCLMLIVSILAFSSIGAFLRLAPNSLLVVGFAAIMILPAAKTERETRSNRENRNLATFPNSDMAVEKGISSWCKAFENAFADRFFLRYSLMDIHSAITGIFDDRGNAKVVVGFDGWLFLKKTLEDFSNGKGKYDDTILKGIQNYLNSINDYAVRNGKKFVFIIAPDKCRVYPEKVKFFIKAAPDSESRTEKLVKYLRENCDFPVIYPREKLLSLKDSNLPPLYYSCDTHWSYVGAYFGGYLPIMEALALQDTPILEVGEWHEHQWWGDLRLMLRGKPPTEFAKKITPRVKKGSYTSMCPIYDADDGVTFESDMREKGDMECVESTSNPRGKHNVYLLRDSFSYPMHAFLARSFEKTTARHVRRGIKPEDVAEIDKCDVIVLEIVERDASTLAYQHVPAGMRKEAR